MKNKEFYVEQILECIMRHNSAIAIDKKTGKLEPCDLIRDCENCKLHTRNISCTQLWSKWLEEEHEEPVLTREEKEYIENIVKPFKNRVKTIEKRKLSTELSYVSIYVQRYNDAVCTEYINLPYFNGKEMYTGMLYFHKYTMKELGLFNDETAE